VTDAVPLPDISVHKIQIMSNIICTVKNCSIYAATAATVKLFYTHGDLKYH